MVSHNLSTPVSESRKVTIPGRNASWVDGIGKLDVLLAEVVKRMLRIVEYRKPEPILRRNYSLIMATE